MTDLELAASLYEAFDRHDGAALAALLSPGFSGHVSEGLPGGGGVVGSPGAMLTTWGRAARAFDLRPRPDQIVPLADGRVLVLGRYVGTARATGRPIDAVFAHVLRFADEHLVALDQITDTARWHEALRA